MEYMKWSEPFWFCRLFFLFPLSCNSIFLSFVNAKTDFQHDRRCIALAFPIMAFPLPKSRKKYSNHYNPQMPKANIASQQSRLEGDERKLRDISNKKKSSERDLGNRRTEHGALEHAAKEHDRKVKHRDELVAQFAQTQSMYVPPRIFPPPHRHLVESERACWRAVGTTPLPVHGARLQATNVLFSYFSGVGQQSQQHVHPHLC